MKPEPPTGTVLIVDDHPTNIGLLLDYLSDSGLKVLVAQDGLGALELVDYASPDIILLDVMMPGLDGFETCRRLKQKQATHDIPVIFMTALSETVGATLCLALRDAVEQAVGHGVPREAAMDFMLGHINIELAIAFGAFPEGKFSDGALLAIEKAKPQIFRDGWLERIFDPAAVKASVKEICNPQ